MIPEFKKLIIKGAPPQMRMSLSRPIQACLTIQHAIDFFKNFRELDSEKVVSFQARTKYKPKFQITKPKTAFRFFNNIKPFGRTATAPRNRTYIQNRNSRPWTPFRVLTGYKRYQTRTSGRTIQPRAPARTYQPARRMGNPWPRKHNPFLARGGPPVNR